MASSDASIEFFVTKITLIPKHSFKLRDPGKIKQMTADGMGPSRGKNST